MAVGSSRVRTSADGDGRIGATFGTECRGFESLQAYHFTRWKPPLLRAGSPARAADDSNGDSNPAQPTCQAARRRKTGTEEASRTRGKDMAFPKILRCPNHECVSPSSPVAELSWKMRRVPPTINGKRSYECPGCGTRGTIDPRRWQDCIYAQCTCSWTEVIWPDGTVYDDTLPARHP